MCVCVLFSCFFLILYDIPSQPHTDGPLYFPQVAILSLEAGLLLDVFEAPTRDRPLNEHTSRLCSVYLQPRSLLVFRDDVYLFLFSFFFRIKYSNTFTHAFTRI